jgi:ribose transport system permease protein
MSEAGILISLALLVLLFYSLEPAFLSATNLRAMASAVSFVGIIAVGQTLLLMGGEFDLSVGNVAGLCAVVSARLMTTVGFPVAVSLILGILLGIGLGLVNGLLVVKIGIPAFIATLGMFYVASGMTLIITHGYPIYPLPQVVGDFGIADAFWGIGWSFVILIVLVVVGDLALRRTIWGRNLAAVGGNKEIARLVGVNTDRYKISCFMLTGGLSALAGMLVMAELASGSTSIGNGWELTVIAGVVIGGVSLFGGIGSVVAGFIGMVLLQVVQSGLVVVGVSANWQTVAVGVIMVLAVALDIFRRRVYAGTAPKLRRPASWRRARVAA